MKIRPIHVVVFFLISASAILAYGAMISSLNPYLTVSQVTGNSTYLHQEIQLLATVSNFSIEDEGTLLINLTDGNSTIMAHYSGVPPQGLKIGEKIVVIGVLIAPNRINTTQLLVKCPSKYE
jgi:cytochrome c-type biogenesis protein CcmE